MSTHDIRRHSLNEIRHLATVDVAHETRPSAASVLGISRDTAFQMARDGRLPVIRCGRRVLVPVPELRRMLGDLP